MPPSGLKGWPQEAMGRSGLTTLRIRLANLIAALSPTEGRSAVSWRVARSLEVLLGEINAAAPNRSKVSDGSIGDAAHASRESDHNPWVIYGGQGIVRARDFTHDPAGGLDCNYLATQLAALIAVGGHPACRSGAYVIWNRRIFSFDRRNEGWRTYTGSNPHDHHCHLSVSLDAAGFDSTAMWGVMIEEDPMADYEAQLNRIERKLDTFREASHKRQQGLLKALDDLADEDDVKVIKKRIHAIRAEVAADSA